MQPWQEEKWADRDKYEKYYFDLTCDLEEKSKNRFRAKKKQWMAADKRLELIKNTAESFNPSPTQTRIQLVPHAAEKHIAALTDDDPVPIVEARQPAQESMAGATNYLMNHTFDANRWKSLKHRVAMDGLRFGMGCVKVTISDGGNGPFGQPKAVKFSKVDPRCLWPDPYAASWRWDDMAYLVVSEVMDLADIRNKFPEHGKRVSPEIKWSVGMDEHGEDSDLKGTTEMDFSSTKDSNFTLGERHRAVIRELYIKDQTEEFHPALDLNGNPVIDEDGDEIGEWMPKYPNGRLIISANGVILFDDPIPFMHGRPPYAYFLHKYSPDLFSYGDIELLARIEDKFDVIQKDMMKNARVNMNSPWIIDNNALGATERYKNLTNERGLVITKEPGSEVKRLPPSELPQFVFPLLSWLGTMFNDLSGVSDIQQGNIQGGAQLSAQAIQTLQGSSANNIKVKKALFNEGVEDLGYLTAWTIRQAYDSSMSIQVPDPTTGEKHDMKWAPLDDDKFDAFDFDVKVISGVAAAKGSMFEQALKMYDYGLIDKEQFHAMTKTPGRDQFLQRMKKREEQLAALGLEANLKQRGNKNGAAGRKVKTFDL